MRTASISRSRTVFVKTTTDVLSRTGGILALVFNYTGDRLNFGLAIERFRLEFGEDRPIHMVIIADDVATGKKGAGSRGLSGGVLMLKASLS